MHCTDMNEKEILIDDDFEPDDFELDDDEKRVANILVPGQEIEDLPDVSLEMLDKYYQYLPEFHLIFIDYISIIWDLLLAKYLSEVY